MGYVRYPLRCDALGGAMERIPQVGGPGYFAARLYTIFA